MTLNVKANGAVVSGVDSTAFDTIAVSPAVN